VLHRSARTLRAWRAPQAGAAKTPELRGRPAFGSTVTERNLSRAVAGWSDLTGWLAGMAEGGSRAGGRGSD
jgi:hypothetical protein